jgi:hypothetical protein
LEESPSTSTEGPDTVKIVPAKATLARLPRFAVLMVLAFGPAGPPASISEGTSGAADSAGGPGFVSCAGAARVLVAARLATNAAQSFRLCNVQPLLMRKSAGQCA